MENEKMKNLQENTHDNKNTTKGKMTGKRIAALLCVFLLVALYLITLLVAIFDRSSSGRWFFICLIGTLVIPLLTWIYIWMYGIMSQKHTIASFDLKKEPAGDAGDCRSDKESKSD